MFGTSILTHARRCKDHFVFRARTPGGVEFFPRHRYHRGVDRARAHDGSHSRADDRPPVEFARLGVGLLWGVPISLGLWAVILYALWRVVS